MRFRYSANMPARWTISQHFSNLQRDILDHPFPRQRMNLALSIRGPRQLGIMEHDESIIERHMNVGLDSVSAVLACLGKGRERVLGYVGLADCWRGGC